MSGNDSYVAFSRAQISQGKAASPVTAEGLTAFLQAQPDIGGTITRLAFDDAKLKAGASSGTLLFDIDISGEDGSVRTRELVFRYDLGGLFFKQYQLEPQYWVMRAVRPRGVPAPNALWLDAAGQVAGHQGLVMERVHGAAPSMSLFGEGPLVEADPAGRRAMVFESIRVLAHLHGLDVAEMGLTQYEKRGTGDHFMDREINWLLNEMHLALDHQLDGPSAALYREQHQVLSHVGRWLTANAPRHRAPELVHGDSMLTNFMFDGLKVAALLDWENTHIGMGEVDIAYQSAGRDYFGLTAPPPEGLPSEDEMRDRYRAERGKLEDWDYARVMGAWRAGLISVLGKSRLPAEMDDFKRKSWSVTLRQLGALDALPACPLTGAPT